jgi:hypothetical protein
MTADRMMSSSGHMEVTANTMKEALEREVPNYTNLLFSIEKAKSIEAKERSERAARTVKPDSSITADAIKNVMDATGISKLIEAFGGDPKKVADALSLFLPGLLNPHGGVVAGVPGAAGK